MPVWRVFLVLLFVASVFALFSENAVVSFLGALIILLFGLAAAPFITLLPEKLHGRLFMSGRLAEAERLARFVTSLLEGMNRLALKVGINFDRELVAWQGNLASSLLTQGRLQEVVEIDSRRLIIADCLVSELEIANIQASVAFHFLKSGRFSEAAALINAAQGVLKTYEVIKERELSNLRKMHEKKHPEADESFTDKLARVDVEVARMELQVARNYLHLGLWTEAGLYEMRRDYDKELDCRRQCLMLQEDINGRGHVFNVHSMAALGLALCRTGNLSEAAPLIEESYRLRNEHYGPDGFMSIFGIVAMAKLLYYQKEFAKSEEFFSRALKLAGSVPVFTRVDEAEYLADAALTKLELGKFDEAGDLLNRALERKLTFFLPEHPEVAGIYDKLAQFNERIGKTDEASQYTARSQSIMDRFRETCFI